MSAPTTSSRPVRRELRSGLSGMNGPANDPQSDLPLTSFAGSQPTNPATNTNNTITLSSRFAHPGGSTHPPHPSFFPGNGSNGGGGYGGYVYVTTNGGAASSSSSRASSSSSSSSSAGSGSYVRNSMRNGEGRHGVGSQTTAAMGASAALAVSALPPPPSPSTMQMGMQVQQRGGNLNSNNNATTITSSNNGNSNNSINIRLNSTGSSGTLTTTMYATHFHNPAPHQHVHHHHHPHHPRVHHHHHHVHPQGNMNTFGNIYGGATYGGTYGGNSTMGTMYPVRRGGGSSGSSESLGDGDFDPVPTHSNNSNSNLNLTYSWTPTTTTTSTSTSTAPPAPPPARATWARLSADVSAAATATAAASGGGGERGDSSSSIRPQFRSKIVCELTCRHCTAVVCRRGMKAILLADMNIELFSTDVPPQGVSLVNDDYQTRNCFCRIRDVACLGCGNVIGYHVTQPCDPCMEACNNGHFWMFHISEVAYADRLDAAGNRALLWAHLPKADSDQDMDDVYDTMCR